MYGPLPPEDGSDASIAARKKMHRLGVREDPSEFVSTPGALAYATAIRAVKELLPELEPGGLDGVLWMHDDNVLVLRNMVKLPLNQSWAAIHHPIDLVRDKWAWARRSVGLPTVEALLCPHR